MKLHFIKNTLLTCLFLFCLVSPLKLLASEKLDYLLGVGDSLKISVFRSPEFLTETRVSAGGVISFPLIGEVNVGGKTIHEAEQIIAKALVNGGFVQQPQVNVMLLEVHGNQVTILGMVNRPGRYPLDAPSIPLIDALALAGGSTPSGSDEAVLTGVRNGQTFKKTVNIAEFFLSKEDTAETTVMAGDQIYVHRAPVFYIYGEAQHSSSYRVERNMTVVQALAQGGGPTMRGTQRNIKLYRRNSSGVVEKISPELTDLIQADDVLFVEESIF